MLLRQFSAVLVVPFLACVAHADEGMWTFDRFPADKVKSAHGFEPSQAWLDRLRLRIGRINECSAFLVSGEGLVQTNYHCVKECAAQLRPATDDPATQPYIAARGTERQCPAQHYDILLGVSDATRVLDDATAGLNGEAYAERFEAESKKLVEECEARGADRHCELVPLYSGAQQKLYEFKRYKDVRLVFLPEFDVGYFGGDADNFSFPRFVLDVAYLRLYENGRPALTPDHLTIRAEPVVEGELLFVAGSPAYTGREWAMSTVRAFRDEHIPFPLMIYGDLRARIGEFMRSSPENAALAPELLFQYENYFKSWRTERNVLARPGFFAQLEAREADLRSRIAANSALAAEVGSAFDEIEAAEAIYRLTFMERQFFSHNIWDKSPKLDFALELVNAAEAAGKAASGDLSSEPLDVPDYVLVERRVEPKLEKLILGAWLAKAREFLTPYDPLVIKVLGKESAQGLADRLADTSRLGELAERQRLANGGARAVLESRDPMIIFARLLTPEMKRIDDDYEASVSGPIARASARIATARFKLFGESVAPDATETPRLSYGVVKGWAEPDGRLVGPFTTFGDLRQQAGAPPNDLPPLWDAAIDTLASNTILNFVATLDAVGGNSGSAVVDREGRVVGAYFDGNIHGNSGYYLYDPKLNRAVLVASTAIDEAMSKVYGLKALVEEMGR